MILKMSQNGGLFLTASHKKYLHDLKKKNSFFVQVVIMLFGLKNILQNVKKLIGFTMLFIHT